MYNSFHIPAIENRPIFCGVPGVNPTLLNDLVDMLLHQKHDSLSKKLPGFLLQAGHCETDAQWMATIVHGLLNQHHTV